MSGLISSTGPDIDLQDTLGIDQEDSNGFYAIFEHPVPVLPNVMVRQNDLANSATAILNETVTFDGEIYLVNTTVSSAFDLSHTNYVFYYELLDNWVTLDLGLNVLNFDGDISIQDDTQQSFVELSEYVPALYINAEFEIPATNFYFGLQGSIISYDDNEITDTKYSVGWESDFGLGIEAGYKNFSLNWTDLDNSTGDVTFDGYYASVFFHF